MSQHTFKAMILITNVSLSWNPSLPELQKKRTKSGIAFHMFMLEHPEITPHANKMPKAFGRKHPSSEISHLCWKQFWPK